MSTRYQLRFRASIEALLSLTLAVVIVAGCDGTDTSAPSPGTTVTTSELSPADRASLSVKAIVESQLSTLHEDVLALQAAVPTPDGDGWSAASDADAVAALRAAWQKVRADYVELAGALTILFPTRRTLDPSYDSSAFVQADPNPFDGEGFVGLHAIERILYADAHPPAIVAFESKLPHYVAARFPANQAEARDFQQGLVAKLVADITQMRADMAPLALDLSSAYRVVVASVRTQPDLLATVATSEELSPYAQATMLDMRARALGGSALFEGFAPIADPAASVQFPDKPALFADIRGCFERVKVALNAASTSERAPAVPASWTEDAPSAGLLATPYGQLWSALTREIDEDSESACVTKMVTFASRMGIDPF